MGDDARTLSEVLRRRAASDRDRAALDFEDRSFTFITKTPPVPVLIKRAVNLAKGSAEPHKTKVGKITDKQIAALEATQLHHHEFHGDWNYTLTADHIATRPTEPT